MIRTPTPTVRFVSTLVAILGLAVVGAARQGGPPQAPAPAPAGGRGGAQGRGATFPAQQRTLAEQAVIDRGKTLFGINCSSCHGPDARGGDQGGPNLLRSQVILDDQHGELVMPIVRGSRQNNGMDPINLPDADIVAVAEYIHSLAAAGRGRNSMPLNVLVGNAAAGQTAFAARCGTCHSVTGDLKGIGARIPDAMTLQNFWVSGGRGGGRGGGGGAGGAAAPEAANAKPTTVTVTPATGPKIEGRLVRIDDFLVSLVDENGNTRTIVRDGDRPKVDVHDPLQAHYQLLPKYTDTEIHDITAYLVTVK
jgi:cytochrome c oxidase cbb3-type subunit 3